MRRDSVLRSTPFRLALAFSLMFLGAFLLTGVTVYELMKWELLRRQDQEIQQSYSVIANAYDDQDLNDLLEVVRANITATRNKARIFLVAAPDGGALAGNIPPVKLADGWSDIQGSAIGLEPDLSYRVLNGNVAGNQLTVGASSEEIDHIEETTIASFAWASIVVAVLAVLGGLILGLRANSRFNAVRQTMVRISHGELSARIPLLGKGDDIDLLAGDINDALARLAMTVEGMRQVSVDIAHDLKTPLNRLKMTVEGALLKQGQGVAVDEELEVALLEAGRINETFEAMLRIAQIESGARKARFSNVDLTEVVNSLFEIYHDVAEDEKQTLNFDAKVSGDCIISGDRELLTQMYVNLIENAIRHCPRSTNIRLNVGRKGGSVVSSVEDDGPGIPAEESEKVFRRLYRLEKSRNSPGTGLGLSLVKAVADLHGARVTIADAAPGLRVEVIFDQGEAGVGH